MNKLEANKSIGIVGGGQLSLMMLPAVRNLGYRAVILDPDEHCASAKEVDDLVIGDFCSSEALSELARKSDFITFEIEKVSVENLRMLESRGKIVRPSSSVLSKVQDKLLQKKELSRLGVPVGDYDDLGDYTIISYDLPMSIAGLSVNLGWHSGDYDGVYDDDEFVITFSM